MQFHVPKPLHGWRAGFLHALCCFSLAASARAQAVPPAIDQDPLLDPLHPASGAGLQFVSNGKLVNAMEYLPAGAGPHAAVILLHGLPGNEQNLDLARAMQRAGWAVITFHYRGSWGSGGKFTLEGGCSDVDALVRDITGANGLAKRHVDPHRIVVVGHSYGGFVAACSAQRHPEFAAVALIAPWDISYDARQFSKLSPKEADQKASLAFNDVDGTCSRASAINTPRTMIPTSPANSRQPCSGFGRWTCIRPVPPALTQKAPAAALTCAMDRRCHRCALRPTSAVPQFRCCR